MIQPAKSPEWARAAALVRAARGEPEGRRPHAWRARSPTARPRSPYAIGRTLLALGQVLRRARRKATRAGAALSEARARVLTTAARRCGRRGPWPRPGRIGGRGPATTALTPTERRVAELVERRAAPTRRSRPRSS